MVVISSADSKLVCNLLIISLLSLLVVCISTAHFVLHHRFVQFLNMILMIVDFQYTPLHHVMGIQNIFVNLSVDNINHNCNYEPSPARMYCLV